jgi:hypothetical protein
LNEAGCAPLVLARPLHHHLGALRPPLCLLQPTALGGGLPAVAAAAAATAAAHW